MSKYTTEVRFICENANGMTESVGYSGIDGVITGAIPKVFDFPFPIFDESYRNVLCGKILKHYYTREICEETVGLWKLRLSTRMNEIMPYYNQLYKSELISFNPLYDVDYKREGNREQDGTDNLVKTNTKNVDEDVTNNGERNNVFSKTQSTKQDGTEGITTNEEKTTDSDSTYSENKNRTVAGTNNNETTANTTANTSIDKTERDMFSETPQGALTNLETGEYLTNARKKTGEESNETTGTSSGTSNTTYNETNSDTLSGESNAIETVNADSTTEKTTSVTGTGNENSTDKTTDNFTGSKKTTGTENGTDNRTINNTEDYLEHISGKMGSVSYSKMLMEFRETFLNIDMMVINALADLFFNLW